MKAGQGVRFVNRSDVKPEVEDNTEGNNDYYQVTKWAPTLFRIDYETTSAHIMYARKHKKNQKPKEEKRAVILQARTHHNFGDITHKNINKIIKTDGLDPNNAAAGSAPSRRGISSSTQPRAKISSAYVSINTYANMIISKTSQDRQPKLVSIRSTY